jgi:hypothetical protein
VAYVGLRWSWTPRIWDPQSSKLNLPVKYNSPFLPQWLSWNEDTLSGIPPPGAESCDVTVEAKVSKPFICPVDVGLMHPSMQFIQDGKEESLNHTVHVNVAPMANLDPTGSTLRRPSLTSLTSDLGDPRRIASDSMIPQSMPTRWVLLALT